MDYFRGAVEFSVYSHLWPFTAARLEIRPEEIIIKRWLGSDLRLTRGLARLEMSRSINPFVMGRALKVQMPEKKFYFVPWRPGQLAKALVERGWIHNGRDAS